MDVVGWVAVAVIACIVLAGVALGLRSMPDAVRYMKIRRM
jgi:hypothetical protein